MRLLNIFFFAAFFLSAQTGWALETVLQYTLLQTHTSPQGNFSKKQKETQTSSKKEVIFGEGFFDVKEGVQERIYDFRNQRIHYLDHRARTHEEISLFADPAFRMLEFQNRLELRKRNAQTGEKNLEDLFTLESIFGMSAEKQKSSQIEIILEKNRASFFEKKQLVAEVIFSEKKSVRLYDQFLIYDLSLHPEVRKWIAGNHKIASVIKNQLRGRDGATWFVLTLERMETRPDQGFQIPADYGFAKKRPGAVVRAEWVIQWIRQTASQLEKKPPLNQDWFLSRAQKAFENKNYLDAALFLFEYGLQTGDFVATSDAMQRVAVFQNQDQDLNRFLRSLGISDADQAKRSLSELQEIDRAKTERGYILDVLIADQKLVLGQRDAAQQNWMQALRVNPYLAGVYKSLGDMLFEEYDTAAAWFCWDFARKLYPQHAMLRSVADYEKDLMKKFPDFFI